MLGSLVFIKPVFAGESPIQTSPANGSTISSSTINWQTPSYSLYATNSFRVQVDDDQSFPGSTINKDYYTKNTYYSPVLNEGLWYWRVKARDASGAWSNWSNIWSFTLQSTSSSPSPSPIPSTTTPSPTPSPTSSSTPSSSFSISNTLSQVNSNQSFTLSVILSLPGSPDSTFYLKGAFKKADSSNYFGLTRVSGSWIKNGSTYSNQYPITTDSSGNWSGNLEVQPDSEDSGFTGSGDYIFKVGRYTSTGSGPTWSNESTINIVPVESSDQGNTSVENSPPTTSPSSSPQSGQSTKSKVASSSKSYTKQSLPSGENRLVYHSATVAAATASANPSSSLETKSQKNTNYLSWAGVLMIVSGTLALAFVYLRSRNLTNAIFDFFRKRN